MEKCNPDQCWNNDKVCGSVKNVMYVKKRLYLEPCYMKLPKWKIFSKYYGWFDYYMWWNYRCGHETKSNDEGKSNDEETKTFPTNLNEKSITYETENFFTLLTFLWITIVLKIFVNMSKTKTFITISQHK